MFEDEMVDAWDGIRDTTVALKRASEQIGDAKMKEVLYMLYLRSATLQADIYTFRSVERSSRDQLSLDGI